MTLIIQVELLDKNSRCSTVFAVLLVMVHVLFVVSIGWNSWATTKASFSRGHFQVYSVFVRAGVENICRVKITRCSYLRQRLSFIFYIKSFPRVSRSYRFSSAWNLCSGHNPVEREICADSIADRSWTSAPIPYFSPDPK